VPGSEDREALAGQWLAAARAVLPKHHAPRGVVWCNLARTETGKWIRPKL
jgi:acyl-coenzyme A synthetase/AMP-(fatty) acid ligase